MAKPPGLCIFCGKGGLSKEHLFADWLRELFPRTPHDTRTQGETWFEASAGQWTSPLRRSFQGHTGSKKLRVVCTKCNNNWVSGIDDAVRNALVPLILGHAIVLDDTLQHKLATWITKVTIVAEYINPNNRAVSKEERLWFWGNRKLEDMDYKLQRHQLAMASCIPSHDKVRFSCPERSIQWIEKHALDNDRYGQFALSHHGNKRPGSYL
jgi:hypothetical protein